MAGIRAPETPLAAPPAAPPGGDRSFWTNKWTVLSLALVGLIVAAAVWLIVDDPDPIATAPRHTDVGEPLPGAAGDACGPGGTGSQVPPAEAPRTSWQLIGSMAAPISVDAGPAAGGTHGVPTCFSPDPVGALFAAATFIAATSDPDLRREVLETLAADTSGRDAALAELDSRGPGPVTVGVQLAGFAFQSYAERQSAVVDLALISRGTLVHVALELTWTDGDWRIVVPVTGRPFDGMQAVPSLAGYVPWQGA